MDRIAGLLALSLLLGPMLGMALPTGDAAPNLALTPPVHVDNTGGGTGLGEEAKLKAPNAQPDELFGTSVAIHGTTLVSSARYDEHPYNGSGSSDGTVHVYELTPSGWQHTQEIIPPDHFENKTNFGTSISLSNDTLLVSDPNQWVDGVWWTGAVYVYERTNSTWEFSEKLLGQPGGGYQFGRAVQLDGDTAVIQAFAALHDPPRRTHIYHRSNGTWNLELTVEDSSMFRDRGVAIDGDTGAIGYREEDEVQVYTRTADGWSKETTLKDPTPDDRGDDFGESVDLHGDRVIVGEFWGDQAHVFKRTTAGWHLEATFDPPPGASDSYGHPVAIEGHLALVGTPEEEMVGWQAPTSEAVGNDAGAIYVYRYESQAPGVELTWQYRGRVTALDASAGSQFSNSLDIHDGTVVVGAYADDHGSPQPFALGKATPTNSNQGSTYVLSTDSDGDGLSDRREGWEGTNASNPDTDGDHVDDATEQTCGWNPRDPNSPGGSLGNMSPGLLPPAPVGENRWWLCAFYRGNGSGGAVQG